MINAVICHHYRGAKLVAWTYMHQENLCATRTDVPVVVSTIFRTELLCRVVLRWLIHSVAFFLWALANTAIVNVINKIVHCFAVTIFSRFHAFNEKSRLTKTNHSERYIHGKMHDWDLSRVYSKLKWEAKFQEYPSEFSRNIPSVIGATPSNKNLDIPCSFLFAAILRSKCKCKSGALRRWQLW